MTSRCSVKVSAKLCVCSRLQAPSVMVYGAVNTFNSITAQQGERNMVFIEPFGLLLSCLSSNNHTSPCHGTLDQLRTLQSTPDLSLCVCAGAGSACRHIHTMGTLCLTACVTLCWVRYVCVTRRPNNSQTRDCERDLDTWKHEMAPQLDSLYSPPASGLIITIISAIFHLQSSICLSFFSTS